MRGLPYSVRHGLQRKWFIIISWEKPIKMNKPHEIKCKYLDFTRFYFHDLQGISICFLLMSQLQLMWSMVYSLV
ncbi:hypothetical protein JOC94_001245 [Bacillus thermophilus]|uniref:Uncharacterized protein n=1 Tax=Siminovitchia thermophila TaxID=1245522 RepID=A0ABS2R3Q9_9BACI|nr:hypothetical protein [Siminovitchia thermophila]ONK22180.1 hypothetical protein BLX87_17285 [Bacillus sp. VT-16-64]